VGAESHDLCRKIGSALNADLIRWTPPVPPGANAAYVMKTHLSTVSPYDVAIGLDSDTLVLEALDELFDLAERSALCVTQMAQWTTRGPRMSKRIRAWQPFLPADIEPALHFGPAINTGVIAFRRDAPIFPEWQRMSLQGRELLLPDETCCQTIIHRYPHKVLDSSWNRSCAHDDPTLPGSKVIHYHGRKHCRPGLPFHADRWVAMFDEVCVKDIAGVRSWSPAKDMMLMRFLDIRKAGAGSRDSCKTLREQIASAQKLKLILGAGQTAQPEWISSDKPQLDITSYESWLALLGTRVVDVLLAEHVLEHLDQDGARAAVANCFRFLARAGRLRIAVPDANHPDPRYRDRVRPGGRGPAARDHKVFYNFRSLGDLLQANGFEIHLLEHWDDSGHFHRKDWQWDDGYVARSFRFDRRNRDGKPHYTSLIIDARKP
jgi:predicted SAM-dependent methyltransferase